MRGQPLARLLAAGMLLSAACAGPAPAPFAVLATNARLLIGDVPEAEGVVRGVEVRGVSHLILWIPTTGQPLTLKQVVDEALARGKGDVLVNATVQRVAWYVPLLYGEYGWIVRGDVVRVRSRRMYSDESAAPPAASPSSND